MSAINASVRGTKRFRIYGSITHPVAGRVRFANGFFFHLDSSGSFGLRRSVDGENWTVASAPASTVRDVAYSPGLDRYVAVGGSRISTSDDDGLTWTSRNTTARTWNAVVWTGNEFVAIANNPTNNLAVSTDGITWGLHTIFNNEWEALAVTGTTVVAAAFSGSSARVCYAMLSDPTVWFEAAGVPAKAYSSISFGSGGVLVAAGSSLTPLTSILRSTDDGQNWTEVYTTSYVFGLDVYWTGKQWVATNGTNPLTSTDGVTWTVTPQTLGSNSICFGNKRGVGHSTTVANGSLSTI